MKIILINFLMVIFIAGEHYLISKYKIAKESSWDKLRKFSHPSIKLDSWFWVACQTIIPWLDALGILTFFSIFGYFAAPLSNFLNIRIEHGLFYEFFLPIKEYPILNWVVWFIAIDFTIYLTHYLMHKSTFLWNWHQFHHAAEDFCILTTARFALGETLFGSLVRAVILTGLLGLPDYTTIKVLVLAKLLFEWLHHSNLPWDYGKFGYIFVSPRFHRFHHSRLVCDHDKNYGGDLAIWDYIFGTVSSRYRADPSLGSTVAIGLDAREDYKTLAESLSGYLPEFAFILKRIKSIKNRLNKQ